MAALTSDAGAGVIAAAGDAAAGPMDEMRALMRSWEITFFAEHRRRPTKADVPDSLRRRLQQLRGGAGNPLLPAAPGPSSSFGASTAALAASPAKKKRKTKLAGSLKLGLSSRPLQNLIPAQPAPQVAAERRFGPEEGWGEKARGGKGCPRGLLRDRLEFLLFPWRFVGLVGWVVVVVGDFRRVSRRWACPVGAGLPWARSCPGAGCPGAG